MRQPSEEPQRPPRVVPPPPVPAPQPVTVTTVLQTLNGRAVVLIAGALILGFTLLWFLEQLVQPIALLILAITIGEALAPLVTRLGRYMPRPLAIAVVYLAIFVLLVAIARFAVPQIVEQAQAFATRVPALLERIEDFIAPFSNGAGWLTNAFSGGLAGFSNRLATVPLTVAGWIFDLFVIVFLSIYWLLTVQELRRFTLSLFPESQRQRIGSFLTDLGGSMGGYVRGVIIDAIIMGTLVWLGLMLIGVQFAIVLGIITAFGELIPVVGPFLAGIPVVGVALLDSPTKALMAFALIAVLQQVESNLLTPNIMRSQTAVSQPAVLFALIAGAAIGGLYVILAAIPTAAALRVVITQAVAPAIRRWTGAEQPRPAHEPAAEEPSPSD